MYREQPAPTGLARWVECTWSLHSEVPIPHHRVAPDGCMDLLYDRRNGLRVVGAMTSEQRFNINACEQVVGLRFRPGMARSFFGISAAELTDKVLPLDDLWSHPARFLEHALDDATTVHQSLSLLTASLRPPPHAPSAIEKSLGLICASHGGVNLDELARHANLSPRQFRRRCLEESGLSPKLLSRILRFRHACRLASLSLAPNWSAIASDAGYFDQAHLIHDFRDLTGLTPMSAFSNTARHHSA